MFVSSLNNDDSVTTGDSEEFSDLGYYITATNAIEDIKHTTQAMSKGPKYNLLKQHDRASRMFIFFT